MFSILSRWVAETQDVGTSGGICTLPVAAFSANMDQIKDPSTHRDKEELLRALRHMLNMFTSGRRRPRIRTMRFSYPNKQFFGPTPSVSVEECTTNAVDDGQQRQNKEMPQTERLVVDGLRQQQKQLSGIELVRSTLFRDVIVAFISRGNPVPAGL
ncbi:hypothetical protein GPALN_002982 [Globodera pallida]|nr:hypothetical protein GPALN_002982 [Globodera pallida]